MDKIKSNGRRCYRIIIMAPGTYRYTEVYNNFLDHCEDLAHDENATIETLDSLKDNMLTSYNAVLYRYEIVFDTQEDCMRFKLVYE